MTIASAGAGPEVPDLPKKIKWISRFNARVLKVLDGAMHLLYKERKSALLAGHPDAIVEIGPGTGANFRYYRPGTHIIAIEPNKAMHKHLQKQAAQYQLILEIRDIKAEKIDMEDNSAPMVIGTLVLCTVSDPEQVLKEIHRILQPGGKYLFVEHVAAAKGSVTRGIQDAVHGPWLKVFEGCHTNRDTATILRQAGFSDVILDEFNIHSPAVPINVQISGYATK